MDKIERAAALIRSSRKTIVLTGAGISTESGIPDFRSPGTGLWEKIDPMEALSTKALYQNPKYFYEVGFQLLTSMADAVPNKAHEILAKLEEEGYIHLLVTQNIDNLHQKAGSKEVLEVHGHTRSGYCLNCDDEVSIQEMNRIVRKGEIPPRCPVCGGTLRPRVVLFGDSLPPCFDRAWSEVEKGDLLIVIGSSLEVGPVNYLANLCKKLMIINLGTTTYDQRADLIIQGAASQVLEQIYEKLH
ncbi:NAD-dependent deacetylase [Anaerosolibacter carboniphilus]|uniref:protein acetyllysine N-acetyltransferase n=1 Tax=Anaerosolibacter carboniphilus TaxID=1417629 RepID=A0A841L0Z7_9FIRM|nr:NAD-dependent protein deacylase [Anaerosolibacter carboniphilus]MBB6218268.1 NAD-dependent deacetylase [Anaerosolibacter carboniphilus]